MQVRSCPDDHEILRPLYERGVRFKGADFTASLDGAAFPKYMVVRILGRPKAAPDADGTLWTVGPHPLREERQALYEYDGRERVLAAKLRAANTLVDITERMEDNG